MDSWTDERDQAVLMQDRYTFAVLRRILRGACDLVLTDHERFILCHSAAPYPIWLWTPDGITDAEKERAWQIASQTRPLPMGFRYNMKYELAAYFIDRARKNGIEAGISMNLFAYDCPAPAKPAHAADGGLHCCTDADIDEAAALIRQFLAEVGETVPDMAGCRERAAQHISGGTFFLWKNASGKTVGCCAYKPDEALASVNSVYTLPEFRRRHYGQNLVYQVTQIAADRGLLPMLYTNADYVASNACYEKIGYTLRGSLCTIAVY